MPKKGYRSPYSKRARRREQKIYNDAYPEIVKNQLESTIKNPVLQCIVCGHITETIKDMIQHFADKHQLQEIPFIATKDDEQNPEYIILKDLVERFIRFKGRITYIRVSNMDIWENLIYKLGYYPEDENLEKKHYPLPEYQA